MGRASAIEDVEPSVAGPGVGEHELAVDHFESQAPQVLRRAFDGNGFGAALDEDQVREAFDRDAVERRKGALLAHHLAAHGFSHSIVPDEPDSERNCGRDRHQHERRFHG
jgi:hypothetical protein